MNDDVRDLASAILALAFAAVLPVIGELHIVSRPDINQSASPQATNRLALGGSGIQEKLDTGTEIGTSEQSDRTMANLDLVFEEAPWGCL